MANKTIDAKLDDILSNQSIIIGKLDAIQTSINNTPSLSKYTVAEFKELLGNTLSDSQNISIIDKSSGQFDFTKVYKVRNTDNYFSELLEIFLQGSYYQL